MVGLVAVGLIAAVLLTDSGKSSDSTSPTTSDRQRVATTVAPPDVDDPRSSVDLEAIPARDDPVELARWWAATYTAYIGTETPDALADRLAPTTTPRLIAELRAIPPAASYDSAPADVEGVSHRTPAEQVGGTRVQVTVETTGALVVYDLVLVPDDDPSGEPRWLVEEAARL